RRDHRGSDADGSGFIRNREPRELGGSVMYSNSTRSAEPAPLTANSSASPKEGTVAKRLTTSLICRGLLAIAVGAISVIWPDVTVGAFVILFAVYAFVAAISDAGRAFSSDRVGSVVGGVLLSLLSLAAGVVALVWPGPTALVLTLIIGGWALVTG